MLCCRPNGLSAMNAFIFKRKHNEIGFNKQFILDRILLPSVSKAQDVTIVKNIYMVHYLFTCKLWISLQRIKLGFSYWKYICLWICRGHLRRLILASAVKRYSSIRTCTSQVIKKNHLHVQYKGHNISL